MNSENRRFYFLSLATLFVLSAYPLINGARMMYISMTNGALEPEQYAKYVIPYAAICVSILFFATLQPVLIKLKSFAFPVGMTLAFVLFFIVEIYFETMQIYTTGMKLIDMRLLAPGFTGTQTTTVDIWQAALCVVSPVMMERSVTYASQDAFFYAINNPAYKIHYYLISLILITMVCGLIYSIAKMLGNNDASKKKPIFLRSMSTAALIALCIFANTTAFFRQAAPVQTPPASALTALFFIVLGAATGIYAGSYMSGKGKRYGVGIPVLLSLCTAVLMYIGEAAMMSGNLYRFGTGGFFSGIPGIVLAPVDILIVILSGGLTWLILVMARKNELWPGKRTLIATVALCFAVAVTGPVIIMTAPKNEDGDIRGNYVFEKNIYTNPLSSFLAFGSLPYVYGFDDDTFTIANNENGVTQRYNVEYYKMPVGVDEFSSMSDPPFDSLLPKLTRYKERYLLAVMTNDYGTRDFGLYSMDGELWLVDLHYKVGVWSIYRLLKS